MDKHKLASSIEHLIGNFERIKRLSASGEIDRLCVDGTSVLMSMVDANKIQKELDELRSRRIDPMM